MRPEAARALALVDLTSLGEDDDEATVAALLERAVTPAGPVAAVCLWPPLRRPGARGARRHAGPRRDGRQLPAGRSRPGRRGRARPRRRWPRAADEIDVVFPFEAYLAGEVDTALAFVRSLRAATGDATLKVILETGRLADPDVIRSAAAAALSEGADFVKTSTGKRSPGATPEAARAMLEAIRDAGHGGFKASGGVKTTADAAGYLAIADELLGPEWATPATFRIGASGLLDDLLTE